MADENRMQEMGEAFQRMMDEFLAIQCRYSAAMKEVQTKLEILDDEFQMKHRRNPIHHIESRLKSIQSIMGKLKRKQFSISMHSAVENLKDIAGIRVICSYVEDVYTVARLLTTQDDVKLVEMRDYIQNPKPNGYRSLHIVVDVPVYISQGKLFIPVEIQIRTVAMDFWATLEHGIRYKSTDEIPQNIVAELRACADVITETDYKMQEIFQALQMVGDKAEETPESIIEADSRGGGKAYIDDV